MNKKIFLIPLMFLLFVSIAFAYSTDPQDYVFADFGDRMRNGTFSNTPADADGLSTARYSYTTNDCVYDDDLQKNGNMSIKCYSTGVGLFLNQFNFGSALSGVTINYEYYSLDQSGEFIAKIKTGGEDVVLFGLNSAVAGGNGYFYNCGGGSVESDILKPNDWVNISAEVASDSTWTALRFNGTVVCNRTTGYTGNATGIYWHMQTNIDVILDNILVWNGSVTNRPTGLPPPDITPPTSTTPAINNTTPKKSEDVNPSCAFADETSMSSIFMANNLSGWINFSSVNYTGIVLSGNFSPNVTNTLVRGQVVGFKCTGNDTSGNSVQSSTITYTVADTSGKLYLKKNITTLRVNDVINISCNITEADGDIDFGMILNNQTGLSVNTTFDIDGYNANFSVSIPITATRGHYINFTCFYNTTDGIFYINSTNITVTNTVVPKASMVNTSGVHYNKNQTFNVTPPIEIDGDTLTYSWFYIPVSTGNFVFIGAKQDLTNWTTNLTDGGYNISINISDGFSNTTSIGFNFSIDSSIPTIPSENISAFNNTYLGWKVNISIGAIATDPDIFNSSINVSRGKTYQFIYNDTVTPQGTLAINFTLNNTLYPNGKYNITFEAVDTNSIPIDQTKTSKGKKGESFLMFNDSRLNQGISLAVSFKEKDNKDTDTPANLKSSIYIDERGFVVWQNNFTILKPETTIIYNVSVTKDDIKILHNTNYLAHLLFGKDYGANFNGTMLVNGIETDYTAIVTRINKKEVRVQIIPLNPLTGNDIVVFTSDSLYGLNHIVLYSQIIVDNTDPAFSSIGQKPIDIIETTKQVNLSVNITDTYLNTSIVILWWRVNLTNGSLFCWNCINKTQQGGEWLNTNDSIHSLDWNKTFALNGSGSTDTWQFNFSSTFHDVFDPHTSQINDEILRNLTGVLTASDSVGYEDVYSNTIIMVNTTNWFIRDDGEVDYDIEFIAKSKAQTKISDILEIGYCNSTYTTGDVTTSNFCKIEGAITIDDTTNSFGFYEKVVQANKSGYFGDVKVTENGTIFFISTAPNSQRGWQLKWVKDGSTSSEAKTSSDNGVTATAYNTNRYFAVETDFFSENFTFNYLIQAQDFAGNIINSTVVSEVEELANEPPTECIITSPTEGDNVSGIPTITWIESQSDEHSFYYNISVYNTTTTEFSRTLGLVYKGTETLSWNTTTISDKNYTLSCQAIENVTDGSVSSNLSSTQIFTGNFTVDNTAPNITLSSPSNNTVITDIEKPDVTFKFSSSETVKNCSLFSNNGLIGNESTQSKSYNITINDLSTNDHKWNVTCYDVANNLGSSGIFNLEIKIISGGSSSTPESAGGGGAGTPSIEANYTQETTVRYTLDYICGKVEEFLKEKNNPDFQDIISLQDEIRWEKDVTISYLTLKDYIYNFNKFCLEEETKQESKETTKNETFIEQIAQKIKESETFSKILNFDIGTYFQLPFIWEINFGQLDKNKEENTKDLFDIINIFLPLSISDELSENPNIVWEGKVRIVPLLFVLAFLAVIIYISIYFNILKKL